MILGVTGNFACGKDTVALILQKQGFVHISLSDMIREELKRRKIEITRETLTIVGNDLRQTFGPDILAKRVFEKMKKNTNYVLTSFRNPAEVLFFRKKSKDFSLILIKVSDKVRLQRILLRGRKEGDPKTLEELRVREKIENSKDPHAQQLEMVAKMANKTLMNDSTIEKLEKKVQELLKKS